MKQINILFALILLLAISVILTGIFIGVFSLYNLDEQKESGVNIGCHVVSSQGQGGMDNLSGMESVKVHGTVWNTGRKKANNVTITIIFADVAHNKVVRNTTIEGVELLPEGRQSINFDSEYLRELTIPKTAVEPSILIEWEEDGELKTLTYPLQKAG